jgi:DNA anti-recombination protein RmuC
MATTADHLQRLDKEDARIQAQLTDLVREVGNLKKEVGELSGLMKGIDKRLDEKDKHIEMIIELRFMKELEKLRAEFEPKRPSRSGIS